MGWYTIPAIILPSFSKAIVIAKCGMLNKKFVVPSNGSIIHLMFPSEFLIVPVSSARILNFG